MSLKTPLHGIHLAFGAKMGVFAGYEMPLYYPDGVIKEHEWVRSKAGLFDVSHMGQVSLKGEGALAFMERLTPSSFGNLGINRTKYTVLTNEAGGIVDDLMVTRTGDEEFHMVINAGCKDKDIAWIKAHMPEGLEFHHYADWALLALQGPCAESVLRDVLGIDLSSLPYMALWYQDYSMFISRVGYTGEDGFEISIPGDKAAALWNDLMAHADVAPIGLAARDSLRLEMGYCLYGHDIDATTTPIEAGLNWVIGKSNTGFIGAEKILSQKETGPLRRRVGLKLKDKGIAREGAIVRYMQDEVGVLTSGGFSPTLKESICIAYVDTPVANIGETITVIVRDRALVAEIVNMPFVRAKTKSMKAVS